MINSNFARLVAGVLVSAAIACAAVGSAQAQQQGASIGGFDGSSFTCLNFTNGLSENATGRAQTILGRVWMVGYLAGYLKQEGKLELSADKADEERLNNLMLQKCREFPATSLLVISRDALAKESIKMPEAVMADLSLGTYSCAQHTAAKAGGAAEANKVDIAELWAIAFIQGVVSAKEKDMVLGPENKPALVGAIAKNCQKQPDVKFLDLTHAVSGAIKTQAQKK